MKRPSTIKVGSRAPARTCMAPIPPFEVLAEDRLPSRIERIRDHCQSTAGHRAGDRRMFHPVRHRWHQGAQVGDRGIVIERSGHSTVERQASVTIGTGGAPKFVHVPPTDIATNRRASVPYASGLLGLCAQNFLLRMDAQIVMAAGSVKLAPSLMQATAVARSQKNTIA